MSIVQTYVKDGMEYWVEIVLKSFHLLQVW